MKHYVVLFDYGISAYAFDNFNGIEIVGVAHTLEEAKEILAKESIEEKTYAMKHDWEILEDSDIEFDAGEAGNYVEEHAHFYIKEVI